MSLKAITDFGGGKALLTNIPPGMLIWIRIRIHGLKNVVGDWSDPGQDHCGVG
jgi:hypothetical protein